jgi:uncharacterized protein YlzI (FlbEa/FlbD family)
MTSTTVSNEPFLTAFIKAVKKIQLTKIHQIATELDISITYVSSKKKVKKDIIEEIIEKISSIDEKTLVTLARQAKLPIEVEVKKLLELNISLQRIVVSDICLTLEVFLQNNKSLQRLFTCSCDLVIENDVVKSNNCQPEMFQGLYVLSISPDGRNDYIVKLGSFAETQGLFKRITSFGGGNYETGSLTNKWFQRFIKIAIRDGYTAKFTYFNNTQQQKIIVKDLNGEEIEMMPYVMRPLETQLFKLYCESNDSIPPIFGSNCL